MWRSENRSAGIYCVQHGIFIHFWDTGFNNDKSLLSFTVEISFLYCRDIFPLLHRYLSKTCLCYLSINIIACLLHNFHLLFFLDSCSKRTHVVKAYIFHHLKKLLRNLNRNLSVFQN